MTPSGIVTLLTDFGTQDPFVGVMKGVMLARAPRLTLVDLTHAVEPQAVADAAFWLAQSYAWFPAGSVHVAVVDPGVGSERAAVVVEAGEHCFVGPDNGLFELVLRRTTQSRCFRVDAERLGLRVLSRTFHGRDVFAPVGALLAAGTLTPDDVGPAHAPLRAELVPEPELGPREARGVVVVVDRFGNLITNVPANAVGAGSRVAVGGHELVTVGTYADVPLGSAAAVVGSCGTLEVFVRDGSACERFSAKRGAPVRVMT